MLASCDRATRTPQSIETWTLTTVLFWCRVGIGIGGMAIGAREIQWGLQGQPRSGPWRPWSLQALQAHAPPLGAKSGAVVGRWTSLGSGTASIPGQSRPGTYITRTKWPAMDASSFRTVKSALHGAFPQLGDCKGPVALDFSPVATSQEDELTSNARI